MSRRDAWQEVEAARSAWVGAANEAGGERSEELDRLWREYLDALRRYEEENEHEASDL